MLSISVILPLYNSENTIVNCIKSVLNQSYIGKVEVIVVNDGSKDNSRVIVENLIENNTTNTNIRLVNKENGGVSSARNVGMKLAKGDWIALLDSDDEWFIDKLEKQVDFLSKNELCSFLGGLINQPSNKYNKKATQIYLSQLISKNYFQPSTVIFKREIIKEIGFFDETQNYAEEGNYFMRIANSYTCFLMNEQVILYGQGKDGFGESGLSANLIEMEKGELRNLKFAYQNRYIGFFTYCFSIFFSVLKYLRRVLIVKWRKL
jgi:glycosyltransferase involved in cell wall biosynthesis